MLHHAISCCTMLYHAVLCCIIQYHTVSYYSPTLPALQLTGPTRAALLAVWSSYPLRALAASHCCVIMLYSWRGSLNVCDHVGSVYHAKIIAHSSISMCYLFCTWPHWERVAQLGASSKALACLAVASMHLLTSENSHLSRHKIRLNTLLAITKYPTVGVGMFVVVVLQRIPVAVLLLSRHHYCICNIAAAVTCRQLNPVFTSHTAIHW